MIARLKTRRVNSSLERAIFSEIILLRVAKEKQNAMVHTKGIRKMPSLQSLLYIKNPVYKTVQIRYTRKIYTYVCKHSLYASRAL